MRFLLAAFLAIFVGLANAADNPFLLTGTLTLEFTPEWRLTPEPRHADGRYRVEGRGPQGEFLIMNYLTLLPDAPADVVEHHWQTVREFATEKMPSIAASREKEVSRPLTETVFPDGRVQFSTVSKKKKMFRDYYFLQYFLGSRRSMAYMTVEGFGNAEAAAQSFEKILATQQWNE